MKKMSRFILGVVLLSTSFLLAQFAYWPSSRGGNGH
jgi:hypothetical protein